MFVSACVIAALARLSNGLFFCSLYVHVGGGGEHRCVRRIWAREYMMLSELHQLCGKIEDQLAWVFIV